VWRVGWDVDVDVELVEVFEDLRRHCCAGHGVADIDRGSWW
jgi:hypothetical protein